MSEETVARGERFVIEHGVEEFAREVGTERAAGLHRTHRPTGGGTAADLVDELPESHAERRLEEATKSDVARQLERQRAARAAATERCVSLGTAHQDLRYGRERQHIVDDGRATEEPLVRRQRRLGAHLTALALQALEQRGLLTTDIRPCTDPQLDVAVRKQALRTRHDERVLENLDGARILGADVDEPLACTDHEATDHHALQQRERIALHQHAVGEGARVTLISVADDVLELPRRLLDGAPFDAGREPGTAPTAQTRCGDRCDRRGGAQRARAGQALPAALRDEIIPGERVDDAAAHEGPPRLTGHEGMLQRIADAQRVTATLEPTGCEKPRDIGHRHRPVADAAGGGLHLDQRFEPMHTMRPVAHDLDRCATPPSLRDDGG